MGRLSEDQKRARRAGLGASDIAEMLGISPYQGASPVRLFAEKAGLLDEEPEEETIEQEVGHALERALVAMYERKSGHTAIVAGDFVESVVHPELPWARCNLDARIEGHRFALEVKTVGIGMAEDWDLNSDDGIPHYVRVQVAWQCFVADLDEVHVVALVGGPSGFRVFYVKRDPELEAVLVAAARDFWRNVQERKAPPVDASAACRAYLEKLYPSPPEDVEIVLVGDEPVVEIGDRRVKMADLETRAKEAKEIANAELREAMGKAGATVLLAPRWKAIWRTSKDGSRPLLVKPRGEAKLPRHRTPKPNAANRPVVEDGEIF